MGNPDVHGLTAVNSASQGPAAVWDSTVVDKALLTVKALSAKGFDIDSDSVPGGKVRKCASALRDNTNHFVSYNNSGAGFWHAAMLNMDITGTDGCHCNLDDGV